ncbi:Rrp15p-domain-containing protein [Geopyxis carbonaria]|nr:Rrp15p-domain-containing protein [Geopyxis carbonaria]
MAPSKTNGAAETTRAVKKRKTTEAAAAPAAVAAKDVAVAKDAEVTKDASDNESDADDKYESAEESSDDGALDDEFDDDSSSGSSNEAGSDIDDILAAQHEGKTKKRKRHDAAAFSTSMSKILSSHLTTAARKDPVLVRAKQMATGADTGKLEAKARRVQKEQRRREKERGRVRELVPTGDDDEAARVVIERERQLRGVARSGVARLYNAIRAAQVKGEEAARGVQSEGVVGMGNREKRVTDMSKQGFLELIQAGGKK